MNQLYQGIIRNSDGELIQKGNATLHIKEELKIFHTNGDSEIKSSAAIRIIGDIQMAAMGFNNGTANGQTHAQSIRFACKKMLK